MGTNYIPSGSWRHISHEKDRPKPAVSLAEEEAEARKIGLSYGVYMGYKDTGYLEEYIRRWKKQKFREALGEKQNVITSHIGGGGRR